MLPNPNFSLFIFFLQDFCNFIPDNSQLEYTQECKVWVVPSSPGGLGCGLWVERCEQVVEAPSWNKALWKC